MFVRMMEMVSSSRGAIQELASCEHGTMESHGKYIPLGGAVLLISQVALLVSPREGFAKQL